MRDLWYSGGEAIAGSGSSGLDMASNKKQLRQALNKAFLKVKPNRDDIERFKASAVELLDRANEDESEEFNKNLISDFLKQTYYGRDRFVNTQGRNDLVVHNGKDAKSSLGVIFEVKRPGKTTEMVKVDNLNAKAFQELLLYFLRDRIANQNLELKHLVITNLYEWFVFDANCFEDYFASDKKLVEQFKAFEEGRLTGKTTDFFYKEIATPAIAAIADSIPFTHFDLRDYEGFLRDNDSQSDRELIALFKLLSPEHLLKLPFANDSNTLDKTFYSELLHVVGLTEVKKGSKKTIERHKSVDRHPGSLIENTIAQLDRVDKISLLENPQQFGDTREAQLFAISLELTITWINRILFLKLLEAQLINYHKGDRSFAFLSPEKVRSYDDLDDLFFSILARKYADRSGTLKDAFARVPYLNSSLFEPTDLEQSTIFISNLRKDETLPIFSSTVLKDRNGKKRSGELNTLEYLFEFLNAYDFSSEGSEDIQEENKTLINASVLGLIFEKINGYKDGSFFTPGFITMYMCRETIRRAVVQKFNDIKGWNCQTIAQLYDRIDDKQEANAIVNSLKICDPAVGSGHFLVSALNEIIAIKSELKILRDRAGKTLRDYHIEISNDELIVTDDNGEFFEYNPQSKESQRVQETLFHEKQTIIENCLFGVDVNPNSVKICRLRLWIELLKNAYYKSPNELETLPNIDINIKCGNSLISRFALDADLRQALKKSKSDVETYRNAVQTYRNAENKQQKREMEQLIQKIKENFRTTLFATDPKKVKLGKLENDLYQLENQTRLFEETKKEQTAREKKIAKLNNEIDKLQAEIEEIETGKIYDNAFEWRFEFPEVLDNNGDFVGFDVAIGNPPYISAIELKKSVIEPEYNYYKNQYSTAKGTVDFYVYFFELGLELLKKDGLLSFISPNRYLSAKYGAALRAFLITKTSFIIIGDYSNVKVFEEAAIYPIVSIFQKQSSIEDYTFQSFTFINETQPFEWREFSSEILTYLSDLLLGFVLSSKFPLTKKIIDSSVPLVNVGNINATSTAREADLFHNYINEKDGFKLVNTGTIDRYSTTWGLEQLTDKKRKYTTPFLPKQENILGENRFKLYGKKKILFAKIALRTEAFLDENGEYASINTNCIHSFSSKYEPYYILGWLNSKLFQYIYQCFFDGLKMSGGYLPYTAPNLSNMYIKEADSDSQRAISKKVRSILKSKKDNPNADTTELERDIDCLVYELYGLTEEEIAIVEEEI